MACAIAAGYLQIVALKDTKKVWSSAKAKTFVVTSLCQGQRVVDFGDVFATLARIKFAGPLTVHIEYQGAPQALIRSTPRK